MFGERTASHREQRADAPKRAIEADTQPLGQGNPGAQPGERPRPDADPQTVQARLRPAGVGQESLEQGRQSFGMRVQLLVLEAGD